MNDPSPRLALPEILAPVGDLIALGAALSAGADAVYFGLDGQFNARAKSEGISVDQLSEVVTRCHRAGAKALVTFNTLIFEPELPRVATLIQAAAEAGVDALIVQDPAVALLAREIAPTLEVHASTQMTISSPEAARFAEELGVTRVVVPRELTVSQIARFKRETPLELEVFIHGALCMSWSGQCLTSEAWGGRSANRGQCAQSCRMPYDLIVDDEVRPLGEVKYLLSPRDLAGVRAVESLMEVGVECLKIEGRYKGSAYVKHTVETYKGWTRTIAEGNADTTEARADLAERLTPLSLAYSRGFSDGFLGGKDHQSLVEGRFPKHRGVFLGYLTALDDEWFELSARGDGRRYNRSAQGRRSDPLPLYIASTETQEPSRIDGKDAALNELNELERERALERGPSLAPLTPTVGMGIVFDEGDPEGEESGGRIAEVSPRPGGWRLRLHRGRGPRLKPKMGARVWVNSDPQVTHIAEREARRALEQAPSGRLGVVLEVRGAIGAPLCLTLTINEGHERYHGLSVTARSSETLTAQPERPLTEETLKSKLTALGGTPFQAVSMTNDLPAACGVAVSALKRLRREGVSLLLEAMIARQAHPKRADALEALRRLHSSTTSNNTASRSVALSDVKESAEASLVPLCRTLEQLEALIECRERLGEVIFDEVELDWMEFVGLRGAVKRAREAGLRVTIATVRVQQPGEEVFDRRIAELKPDGVLLRHWGGLARFASMPPEERPTLHGDFSLNITNSLSAHYVASYGLSTITAAHDLDVAQVHSLLDTFDPARVAVTVHHHIPMFHTEHCVYARSLSDGRDVRSCGHPCDRHRVALRDHKGQSHPVLVDVKCRNTVFNASAQTAATLASQLISRGVRRLRVEFVWENAAQTREVLESYHSLIRGELSPQGVVQRLSAHERFGLTAGTMEVHR